MYMDILPTYKSVAHMHTMSEEARRRHLIPWD